MPLQKLGTQLWATCTKTLSTVIERPWLNLLIIPAYPTEWTINLVCNNCKNIEHYANRVRFSISARSILLPKILDRGISSPYLSAYGSNTYGMNINMPSRWNTYSIGVIVLLSRADNQVFPAALRVLRSWNDTRMSSIPVIAGQHLSGHAKEMQVYLTHGYQLNTSALPLIRN